MKKTIAIMAVLIAVMFCITGCKKTKSISFTYDVETGDRIEIKLDAADGYSMSSKIPFTISKDDEKLTQGIFLTMDSYKLYENAIKTNPNVKVIEKDSKKGNEYTFYSFDGAYLHLIKVDGSDTGILLSNSVSEKSAKECFKRLEFKKTK